MNIRSGKIHQIKNVGKETEEQIGWLVDWLTKQMMEVG